MIPSLSPRSLRLLLCLPPAGILLAHAGLFVFLPQGPLRLGLNDLLTLVGALLAAGSFFLNASRAGRPRAWPRSGWFLLALAYCATAGGHALWGYYEAVAGVEPFPSPADLLFLLFYPLFIVGALRLPAARASRGELARMRLGALAVMLSLSLLLWNYLLAPLTQSIAGTPLVERLIAMAYPVFGMLMVWLLTMLLFRPLSGVSRPVYLLLILSLVLEILSDLSFCLLTLQDAYTSGGLLDLGWAASLILACMAGLYQFCCSPAPEAAQEQAERQGRSASLSRLYFPILWVMAALALLIHAHYRPLPMDFRLVALSVTLIIGLVLLRQGAMFWENQQMHAHLQRLEADQARQERDAYFRALIENSSDPLTVVDAAGLCSYASPAVEKILGYPVEALVGRNLSELAHPEDRERLLAALKDLVTYEDESAVLQYRFRRADGAWLYLETEAKNRLHDRSVGGIVMNSRDITGQVLAYSALKESEERYALAAQSANDGLWDWDMKANRFYLSERWKAQLGYDDEHAPETFDEIMACIHPDDLEAVRANFNRHLQGLTDHVELEQRVRHRDGSWRWMLCRGIAVRDCQGRPTRMAGSLSDITLRKLAEERLQRDAFYDALSGLPNRALFIDRLGQALERLRRRSDYGLAVLFLDLDQFKVYNDSLGHLAGDEILKHTAGLLKGCLRAADTVARLGGDEFVILLEDVQELSPVLEVSDRIHEALKQPLEMLGRKVYLSASIGIVHSQQGPGIGYLRPEEVLRDADTAMYAAKERGKACTVIFDPGMRSRALERLELDSALRLALENRQFRLHYQPILSLQQDRLVGFEALLRWELPGRGLVPPGEFVPVAEETGLILRIGGWVLSEACRQARAWQQQYPGSPPLTMHVNLSGRQLVDPDLAGQVEAVLQASGLDAGCLVLEITESVLVENIEYALSTIERLHALGVELHIDDFGTGYSSLSYIQRLPVDAIKIDRSFISGNDELMNRDELLKSILQLAHSLGLSAIAEGVETEGQLSRLKELGCPFGQGYFIARPLAPEAAETLLSASLPIPAPEASLPAAASL